MNPSWRHPGGKLRELGPASLTEAELLSILISPGIKDRPAELIAADILKKFGSLEGMANQPLEKLLHIKGLSDVKIIRLAAAFELALRIVRKNKASSHEQAQQTCREGDAPAGYPPGCLGQDFFGLLKMDGEPFPL